MKNLPSLFFVPKGPAPDALPGFFRTAKRSVPIFFLFLGASFFLCPGLAPAQPPGLTPSPDYKVQMEDQPLFVAEARVLQGESASFSSFDLASPSRITVTPSRTFKSFKIIPPSPLIKASSTGKAISFVLNRPANLTIELDGKINRPLHLFANPPSKDIPGPRDPGVIYFGPGLHEISTLRPQSGQRIYLAAGAVLRPLIPPGEKPASETNWTGQKEKIYAPLIQGKNVDHVRIDGRGILDLSALPWHSRKAIWFEESSDITIEGIIVLDAPDWAIAVLQCRNVTVRNVKQISARENSDGIDICNSQNVLVEDCFIRCNDDAICVKTISPAPALPAKDIVVRHCLIWNERARALGITSETKADISDVLFQDCDILHDFSNNEECAALALLVSDSGTVSNIRFEQIRVGDCRKKLVRCWIGQDGWSSDKARGTIRDVTFKDIAVTGLSFPDLEVFGFNSNHLIQNVTFQNLQLNGKKISLPARAPLKLNEFTRDIRVTE